MVALKRVTAKTGGKTPHPHRRSGARHTIVWATLANGGRVCGGQSVVVSLWWSVCGGQSVVGRSKVALKGLPRAVGYCRLCSGKTSDKRERLENTLLFSGHPDHIDFGFFV